MRSQQLSSQELSSQESSNQQPSRQEAEEQQVTEQEAKEFQESLQKEAEQWRKRLKDPLIQAQIKAGTLIVSPLVESLLALPPVSTR